MKRRTEAPTPARIRSLHRDLLRWFQREKRDLPWRRTRDPYRIWISEAMLQQTRVETVVPYYLRFLARFPTVEVLARARSEDVLGAWSGLGYYRRAKSLQVAARAVVERHGGRFPSRIEDLLELPGVGPYTAGAIASIAFDHPEALVDGNVIRVLCRLFGRDMDPSSIDGREELWSLARVLVPRRGAGPWNEGLMELGALVCTPLEPPCDRCPLAARCVARAQDRVGELPRKRKRPSALQVQIVVLAVTDGERWLLERRPPGGRMAGMWQMPTIEEPGIRSEGSDSDASPAPKGLLFPLRGPRFLRAGPTLCEVRHTITRHCIRATVKRAAFTASVPTPPLAWVPRDRLEEMALTGMTRKCLAAILAAPGRREVARSPRWSTPLRRSRGQPELPTRRSPKSPPHPPIGAPHRNRSV